MGNRELIDRAMGRTVITEFDVVEAKRRGAKEIRFAPSTMITAAAHDRAAALGIAFVEERAGNPPNPGQSERQREQLSMGTGPVAVGSDHGGYQLKEALKKYLTELGYRVVDVGTTSEEPCDYPDFAYAVARLVSKGEAWRGVVVDGAGIGSAIVANKVPNVRAACCHNEFVARNSREHNDTNILTLGSRVLGSEVAKEILRVWLTTWFAGGRHKKRVDKILDLEDRFLKKT
jgi:ribose 5-phosphate isomerase B